MFKSEWVPPKSKHFKEYAFAHVQSGLGIRTWPPPEAGEKTRFVFEVAGEGINSDIDVYLDQDISGPLIPIICAVAIEEWQKIYCDASNGVSSTAEWQAVVHKREGILKTIESIRAWRDSRDREGREA